jgi:hypothetical protein
VFYINDDAEGGLWFTGNLGLSHVSAEALAAWIADPAQPLAATRLDRLDGLRSSQLNGTSQPAGARDAEGRLWLPSARGVAVLRDDSTILAERPPSVQLEAVLIDGIVTPLAPRAAITLPPTGGRIEFRFSGVNSLLPRAPLYQTRMEGLDSDWSAPESRQSVTYGALNAGDYVFRVRSVAPRRHRQHRDSCASPSLADALGSTVGACAGYPVDADRHIRICTMALAALAGNQSST